MIPAPSDPRRWALCLEIATRCVAKARRPEYGAELYAATVQRDADVTAQVLARNHGRDR